MSDVFMKPKITATSILQFRIPTPYRAWCHQCQQGFMSLKEIQEHLQTEKQEGLQLKPKKKLQQLRIPEKALDYGPPCSKCGTIIEPAGSCYTCPGCGQTSRCS
jgi:hypothetical protein